MQARRHVQMDISEWAGEAGQGRTETELQKQLGALGSCSQLAWQQWRRQLQPSHGSPELAGAEAAFLPEQPVPVAANLVRVKMRLPPLTRRQSHRLVNSPPPSQLNLVVENLVEAVEMLWRAQHCGQPLATSRQCQEQVWITTTLPHPTKGLMTGHWGDLDIEEHPSPQEYGAIYTNEESLPRQDPKSAISPSKRKRILESLFKTEAQVHILHLLAQP